LRIAIVHHLGDEGCKAAAGRAARAQRLRPSTGASDGVRRAVIRRHRQACRAGTGGRPVDELQHGVIHGHCDCLQGGARRFPASAAGRRQRDEPLETLSKAARHDVRIALKRLRYALDFFGGVFEGESKKKFVKRLTRLQDDLGRMNDVAVAETMLARLVGS
jgi:CHAD domain-containing protein